MTIVRSVGYGTVLLGLLAGFNPAAQAQGYSYNYGAPAPQAPGYNSNSYYYGQQPAAPQQQGYPQQQQQQYAPQQGYPQQQPGYAAPGQQQAARTVDAGTLGATGRAINFPADSGDDVDVLKLQVFLDYHGYSPGEIDGRWGYNTERALFVYQKNNALPKTGQLDDRMLQRLNMFQDGYLLEYTLTGEDVKGPFNTIPRSYQEQSRLKWLPYESLPEMIGEKFHMSQSLVKKLNPSVNFNGAAAGTKILVLNTVDGIDDKRGKVSVVRVSKYNKWIEAFDADGKFMFYYPCTLGSEHDPLPLGEYAITTPVHNPHFTYKPDLMWDDDVGQTLDIPPGPNSPVGAVWIGTTRKSVGIHGTPNPENISKNNSHGCIRLANWDAKQLAKRVGSGVKLDFVQ